ncbi:hypothetical protein HaLaN_05704, partial [Haematococcus lacustris]
MFAAQALVVPWWASAMLAGIAAAALLGWGPMLYASLSQRWKYRALRSPPSQLLAGNLP